MKLHHRRQFLQLAVGAAALPAIACVGFVITTSTKAQEFPSKDITLMMPYAAGGPGDTLTRIIGQGMGKALGRQILVENVAGAGGTIGTGMVATAVIFSSALPAMFGTFVKHRFQNTYEAILAAPVDVDELVTAEMLWIAIRSSVYGCVPLIVTFFWGLEPAPGMLLVPLFAFVTALGFAGFGITTAAVVAKIDQFNYVTALFVTPLFLVAGTFFPISGLPEFFQVIAQANPLHQLVELVRGGAFGFEWVDLARFAFLVAFAIVAWRIAIDRLRARLIQ